MKQWRVTCFESQRISSIENLCKFNVVDWIRRTKEKPMKMMTMVDSNEQAAEAAAAAYAHSLKSQKTTKRKVVHTESNYKTE